LLLKIRRIIARVRINIIKLKIEWGQSAALTETLIVGFAKYYAKADGILTVASLLINE